MKKKIFIPIPPTLKDGVSLGNPNEKTNNEKIIDNLMILLELSGDGGFSPFTKKEQDDMYNFLIKLKNNQNMTNEEKEKMSATEFCRCYKCDKIEHNVISEYEPAVTFK